MFSRRSLFLLVISAFLSGGAIAQEATPVKLDNPFFAMETNFRDREYKAADKQAELLADLGYAGGDQMGLGGIAERLKAYDAKKLKLFGCYVAVTLDPRKDPLPPAQTKEAIAALKGRDAVLWLALQSPRFKPSDPNGDELAVKFLRELADAAAPAGVGIAIYPHSGMWVERLEDAVRLAKKADRKNVGATFNLAHWLNVTGGKQNLKVLLKEAAPVLTRVTINGADEGGKGWGKLIQTLDSGSYDVTKVLAVLKEIDYAGPIGLQGYGIAGDSRDKLSRSMEAWKKMRAGEPVTKVTSPQRTRTETGRLDLFKSGDFSAFKGNVAGWKIVGDVSLDPKDDKKLVAKDGNGVAFNGPARTRDVVTNRDFGDCVLHAEFAVAKAGNSGLYFMGRYELQIYDSFGVAKDKYAGLECGGIYPRTVGGPTGFSPKVNASKKPGEWQSFDVTFRAPRFDEAGKKTANACFVKVTHNGQVIHENVELTGPTAGAMANDEKPAGPLRIQGDHGPVAFRNVWIEPATGR
jgi:sugar phosphate isomerase/epimerase